MNAIDVTILWPALVARRNVILLSNTREFDFFPRILHPLELVLRFEKH